jgi:uncharacterized membrane protein YfcA
MSELHLFDPQLLDAWPAWTVAAIVAATIFAGVAHGAVGFGFPLLSTPLFALVTDVRTAVLVSLLPNILLNLTSIVRGRQWRQTLREHWPVAAWVLAGALVGTRVLAVADTRWLRLLLAAMIVVHLLQGRRRAPGSAFALRHPRLAPAGFGLVAGFFQGTVNVALPPLLMYYSTLALPPVVMTQALNLSFLTGRATQAVAVAAAGGWRPELIVLSLPLCPVALASLAAGFRLQRRIAPATFLRILSGVLWVMAALLCAQAVRGYLR